MIYRVDHLTAYSYSEPASLSQNELFLFPRTTASQNVRESRIVISPEPQYVHEREDYFGNRCLVFMIQHPHRELQVRAESIVETGPVSNVDPDLTPAWDDVAGTPPEPGNADDLQAYQFRFASPLVGLFGAATEYAMPSFPPGRPILSGALDLIHRIFAEFEYDKTATTVDTPVEQVLVKRKGVCQDFAHVAISCLRGLGLATRYVSGYLETQPPPGAVKMTGADASHAWLSLHVPGSGWVDLDPTNDLIPDERHITLAWGRDYGDVTPVKGVVMGGGQHELTVAVDVSQLGG